ncbi:MAG: conjugal transfer protein TraX [Lachnospiraceae bacterium]|nr:conjugal transfer protein TraX [Lachnospiraceae bacterium]
MNGFTLKIIASLSMLLDHIGAVMFPDLQWLRYVGRLAFPIYCFLLVEGFYHTRSVARYLSRLFLFALVSEVPFDLYFQGKLVDWSHQNVFFTLFMGLLLLQLIHTVAYLTLVRENGSLIPIFVRILVTVALIVVFGLIAQNCHTDYRYPGILLILSFALFRQIPLLEWLSVICINLRLFSSSLQAAGSLALLPISLYNRKRGPGFKYFFYLFYPGHLLLLYFINDYFEFRIRIL